MLYRVCKKCRNMFTTDNPNQDFCGKHCNINYNDTQIYRKNKKKSKLPNSTEMTMTCAECGKVYLGSKRKGIFCSDICKLEFRSRQEEINNENLVSEMLDIQDESLDKKCMLCGNDFLTNDIENNFCSEKCLHNYINLKKKERYIHPESYSNVCKICGNLFCTPYSSTIFCSRECQHESIKAREKIRQKIGSERIEFIESFVEQLIAKAIDGGEVNQKGAYINYYYIEGFNESLKSRILTRDLYECSTCKSKRSLHIHHIVPRLLGGSHDENNLVTLCAKCHGAIETRDVKYAKRKCIESAILNMEEKTICLSKKDNFKIYNYINSFMLSILNEDIELSDEIKKKVLERCGEIMDNIDLITCK